MGTSRCGGGPGVGMDEKEWRDGAQAQEEWRCE